MPDSQGLILVVDDTPENVKVLGEILRDAGYGINVAMNGEQALASVSRVKPDLVLLDIMMPVMDGYEVCRRLNQNPSTKDIPVIFLSAKTETDSLVKGFDLGAVDYVTKPFQSAELLKRVDTHMTIARLRKELLQRVGQLSEAVRTIENLQREQDAFLRHEMNNVIHPISGYVELLSTNLSGRLDQVGAGWLKAVATGTETMADMLTSLKDLHDFERGSNRLTKLDIPLYGLLEDVISDVSVGFDNDVVISLTPTSFDERISADLTFLPAAFKNVIKNAAEHVAGLETEQRVVRISSSATPDHVIVEIQNGGEPIPKNRLEAFFTKFNTTKNESGTGLGTTYAKIVIDAHGGDIAVSSSPEEGTRVSIRLPRVLP